MKRIALSLLAAAAAVVVATPAQAIVGGPFDNNLFYSPSVDGTYQGTLTAKNVSGVLLFSTAAAADTTSTTGRFGNWGVVVAFVDGRIMEANLITSVAGDSRKIAAVIDGIGSDSINGYIDAKFDQIHPSITFKGKADLFLDTDDDGEGDHVKGRVKGIKTSNNSSFYWVGW